MLNAEFLCGEVSMSCDQRLSIVSRNLVALLGTLVLGTVVACGSHVNGDDDTTCTPGSDECGPGKHCADDGTCVADDPNCVGLECFQVDCASKGLPDTTIKGTVYAPN